MEFEQEFFKTETWVSVCSGTKNYQMLLGIALLFIFLYQPSKHQASLVGSQPLAVSRLLGFDLDFWPTPDLIKYNLQYWR